MPNRKAEETPGTPAEERQDACSEDVGSQRKRARSDASTNGGGKSKKAKKKKKKKDKKKKPKPSLLPSADAILEQEEGIPDFLEAKVAQDKFEAAEAKAERENKFKREQEAKLAEMESYALKEAEKEMEYALAEEEFKARRKIQKASKVKKKGPVYNIMNRTSIHRFH